MSTKEPVLLTVLIETQTHRWFVGGIDCEGRAAPLLCSENGNLAAYLSQPFDEQVSFLRHRLSGVLQRGCDRLWGKEQRPCRIVFVADGLFQQATLELTQRVADHFVEWMTSPSVVFFLGDPAVENGEPQLTKLAGEMSSDDLRALKKGLPELSHASICQAPWEVIPNKPAV